MTKHLKSILSLLAIVLLLTAAAAPVLAERESTESSSDETGPITLNIPPYPTTGEGLSYSLIPSSSAVVDGFGPVAMTVVTFQNGQNYTIPAAPYSNNMVWGTFGTFQNWQNAFMANHAGRAPTAQDEIDFWVSQVASGAVTITPAGGASQ